MLPSLFVAVPLMGAGSGGAGISDTVRLSTPSNLEGIGTAAAEGPSRWRRRTQRRRQRTEELLESISDGGLAPSLRFEDVDVPALEFPTIDWERHSAVDPMIPGKEVRGLRKRAQVEAFYHVLTGILDSIYAEESDVKTTVIDAGCGAGNLAVSIAGLLADADSIYSNRSVEVLAVDTNERALDRLSARSALLDLPPGMLRTCCADLADRELIRSAIEDSGDHQHHRAVVVSLHACGAASDMAMELAYACNDAPFVLCPCCTAKSLTARVQDGKTDQNASFQRSGATSDITYPRSSWLRSKLSERRLEKKYEVLAKVADVGLGPQTPSEQRAHQRRAKRVVELDRLMSAAERRGDGQRYYVRLARIHDARVYGKGEVLIGSPEGGAVASALAMI